MDLSQIRVKSFINGDTDCVKTEYMALMSPWNRMIQALLLLSKYKYETKCIMIACIHTRSNTLHDGPTIYFLKSELEFVLSGDCWSLRWR